MRPTSTTVGVRAATHTSGDSDDCAPTMTTAAAAATPRYTTHREGARGERAGASAVPISRNTEVGRASEYVSFLVS